MRDRRRPERGTPFAKGVELGMALIDTAEMYGYGKAEMLVGQAVKKIRDDVFIATKVSRESQGMTIGRCLIDSSD